MIQFLIVGLGPSGGDGGRELEGSREADIFFRAKATNESEDYMRSY